MGYSLAVILILSVISYFHVAIVLAESSESRVCIIGAGYSGLATARYMKNNGLNYTIFESTNYIGGTWRFDSRIETDEFGVPLFTNQYKKLRVNAPIETMEFYGFLFPEVSNSFPSGECFYKYIQSFTRHFDLMKDIQFQSQVTDVQWTGRNWKLTYMKTDTGDNVTEECDFVVVASGVYNKPYIPEFEGQELYRGTVLHSHAYKDAEHYRDQRVLVIGGAASGIDITLQLSNITSKLVHSHHIKVVYNQPGYPESYIRKPDIERFTPNGAVFEDGSAEEFDIVIYCTGYKYNYPFLNHLSSGVTISENFVFPLHQHIVNINQPTMTFVGAHKRPFAKILDVQAEYAAALAAGLFELPPKDDMIRQLVDQVYRARQQGYTAEHINNLFNDMDKYFETLHKEAGIQLVPPVVKTLLDFDLKDYLEDLVHFRDYDIKIISDTQYEKKYNPREACPFEE